MKTSKKILTSGVILSLILIMAVVFSGCGGPKNLEEYVNDNTEAKQSIDSLSTSGMTVDVKGNTLTYTYEYDQTFDSSTMALMKTEMEKAMSSMDSTFESVVDTLEEGSGIDGITVKVIYKDAAGTEILSKEYK